MIEQPIALDLPKPWVGQRFEIERFGELSFLVGPNGSGKSRFADALRGALPNARLLGTDRLEGMSRSAMANFFGDHLERGYQKINSPTSCKQAASAPVLTPSSF